MNTYLSLTGIRSGGRTVESSTNSTGCLLFTQTLKPFICIIMQEVNFYLFCYATKWIEKWMIIIFQDKVQHGYSNFIFVCQIYFRWNINVLYAMVCWCTTQSQRTFWYLNLLQAVKKYIHSIFEMRGWEMIMIKKYNTQLCISIAISV